MTHALIFTAGYSRHCFVYLTQRQTLGQVIAGFEAAWAFFGGVFRVVIPDNLKAIVDRADAVDPRLTEAFVEYAQSRGFVIDPARVRSPRDKPRVERTVPYVRGSFFAGEEFADLAEAQRRAESWCREVAGQRVHGTTCARPAQVFAADEAPRLLRAPEGGYDLPRSSRPKVHPDRHVEVDRALYSVPGELVGQLLSARADASTVKLYHRGYLIKVHPRVAPGGRRTDPADLPAERAVYALRDLAALRGRAAEHGSAVGAYADALLEHPLPWTRMRQGLPAARTGPPLRCRAGRRGVPSGVGRRGGQRRADRADAGTWHGEPGNRPPAAPGTPGRFARDGDEFAVGGSR